MKLASSLGERFSKMSEHETTFIAERKISVVLIAKLFKLQTALGSLHYRQGNTQSIEAETDKMLKDGTIPEWVPRSLRAAKRIVLPLDSIRKEVEKRNTE